MTSNRHQVAADYVAALTEKEYAEFVASAREQRATKGTDAASREFVADLFRPQPTRWGMATILNTEKDQA